ncbi:Mitotic checkpoint serine/threonine protein kinase, Bub1 [Ophiocordyceps camponoti-floridani]|uniref:Mitotic checkpoint serine/threonine protein kinase, Bub1 n=1 Tax=Ophiocordyceps camponoti-floridani TaxID=2030778 RepID=A0A8H4VFZ0_9HYPO|nr:Mitotic checkpoint serine/threonine protein kinase, Bub1 [Ophiocordyceps camponoti-floridani]
MPDSEDLISFDVIEGEKENIQSLPGGRSAKKLAELATLDRHSRPSSTKTVNDCIRIEYEAELENLDESDDPLDVFDRYVRWTLDAYPSAQATPQSQLHTLLERATKAFITSTTYRNDARYLRLWMHYIHLFADAPRETFLFLSRHGIGDSLALFYEEYAAWLETAGRWAQAAEVYRLGIEREARPLQRLVRKMDEFQGRLAKLPGETIADAPSSPALPTLRPALAAKLDPFASSSVEAQTQQPQATVVGASRSSRPKLAVFSDTGTESASASLSRGDGSKGWDNIGSLSDRKKENTMKPTPWLGETLKAGGSKARTAKMNVFRDVD